MKHAQKYPQPPRRRASRPRAPPRPGQLRRRRPHVRERRRVGRCADPRGRGSRHAPDHRLPRDRGGAQALRLIDELPFRVEWANLSGGPQCSEAFRAGSLDVCSAAEIPAIHARWTGLDTRLVASVFREDPIANPLYELGIAPGADIETLEDLRGKRIAFSPGQAQGTLVLRILQELGLTREDVELVEMPSTGDVYPTALGSGQVDAAPIAGVNIRRYLDRYGSEGVLTIDHGLREAAALEARSRQCDPGAHGPRRAGARQDRARRGGPRGP
ncbi:ABC transporter substrate-binding protein [Streptomyces sp. PT12]|uniref:ABC transporter substrate-binding protein n=1 Tax=Streptomyces sp. PT12 TaxID=1510197 RepID=UPI00215BD297|nr:ABC transporter substrate-binding protein [Streptomyces sp. PT12]